jgi:peptide/nickel transport system ATP-binding protein
MEAIVIANPPLLDVRDLTVFFDGGGGRKIHAVSGISFAVEEGEVLGLVGESGCGKSSIARALLQLPRPAAGQVVFEGVDWSRASCRRLHRLRPRLQMIFQDSVSALNPRRRIGDAIAAPLVIMKAGSSKERARRVREAMHDVGLPEACRGQLPSALSGGQCQRAQIARSLIGRPKMLICDEPVSSLDVSVRAQILNLLDDLRRRYKLAMLFISHDLAVVKNISDRVAVMYLGRLCEVAPAEELYRAPRHPYSRVLLEAAAQVDTRQPAAPLSLVSGELPSAVDPPKGCRFHTRCPEAGRECSTTDPQLEKIHSGHFVACHFPL